MDVVALLVIVLVLGAVVAIVGAPLRSGRVAASEERDAVQIAGLEAAKEAKYREIRDLEMDWRTGKLSEEDYREQDRRLRAEAVEILHALDRLGAGGGTDDAA